MTSSKVSYYPLFGHFNTVLLHDVLVLFEFLHGVYPDVPQRHGGQAPEFDTPDISIPFFLSLVLKPHC